MADEPKTPLHIARKAKGLTLAALANKAGISEGQLSRIERYGKPSLHTAMRLSEATDVPVEQIAFGAGG